MPKQIQILNIQEDIPKKNNITILIIENKISFMLFFGCAITKNTFFYAPSIFPIYFIQKSFMDKKSKKVFSQFVVPMNNTK